MNKTLNLVRVVTLPCLLFISMAGYAQDSKQNHEHHHGHDNQKSGEKQPACIASGFASLACASAPGVAFDPQGKLWLAWVDKDQLLLSSSSDRGKSFIQPVLVNQQPEEIYAKGENRPKIAFGNAGEIYLSWTQKLKARFGGHIRFSRSLDGGKTFSTPVTVNDHLVETSHRFDALGVNDKGHIYLAWLDKRDLLAAENEGKKYDGAALYYALSTDGGKSFHANKKIADNTCQCCRVAIAFDRDQLPAIVWRHIFDDSIRDHGFVKFIEPDQAGRPRRLSYNNWKIEACPHHGPAISISSDNVYHTAWFNNAPDSHGLFYARSHDQGRSFSKAMSFGDYQKAASHAHVLSTGQQVFIVWQEYDGKQSVLKLLRSVDAGITWQPASQLAVSNGTTDHPFLVRYAGAVYASWHVTDREYQLISVSDKRGNQP